VKRTTGEKERRNKVDKGDVVVKRMGMGHP
jgi:hypothetical protein